MTVILNLFEQKNVGGLFQDNTPKFFWMNQRISLSPHKYKIFDKIPVYFQRN